MTPKEKAEELLWKYLPLIDGYKAPEKTDLAKKLALVCVSEILNDTLNPLFFEVESYFYKYWEKVRTEISLL